MTNKEKFIEVFGKELPARKYGSKSWWDQDYVPPVKSGKWIPVSNATSMYSCSKCGRIIIKDSVEDLRVDYPYCHCGSDNRESEGYT